MGELVRFADDAAQSVEIERCVSSEIQDLSGIIKDKAHVCLHDGSALKVSTNKNCCATIKPIDCTRPLCVASRLKPTDALRNALLLEFVEYASEVRDSDLERMIERRTGRVRG